MEIERGVPLTVRGRVTKYRFPLGEMEVGDSFYFDPKGAGVLGTARSLISRYGKTFGRKFATRLVDGGIRVWRIE